MALTKIKLNPGIVTDTTNYTNSGGWFDGNFVRFRDGLPEKIGGWVKAYANQTPLTGICRKMVSWSDINGINYLAMPTEKLFYVDNTSTISEISAARRTVTLGSAPIATTNGSSVITITDVNHGASSGDYIAISGAATVAGISSVYINTTLPIVNIVDGDHYTVNVGAAATSTTTGGGSSVSVKYLFYAGNSVSGSVAGWGYGPWGGAAGPTVNFIVDNPLTSSAASNATINGIPTTVVTVTTPSPHGASIGDNVLLTVVTGFAGISTGELQRSMTILTVPTSTTFTARINGTATASTTGGGTGTNINIYAAAPPLGWGTSQSSSKSGGFTGLWTVDNYGEDMVACPRNMVIPWQLGLNPIATTSGSNTITVTQTNHGYSTGQAVIFSGITDTNGIEALYLNGTHTVTVVNANSYTFTITTASGTAINATSTGSGGGAAVYAYVCPLIYWDSSAGGRAVPFSSLGAAYAKKYLPYTATEVLTSDINRHVIVFGTNTFDPTGGIDKMLIRFSDSNDPTNWDASDTTKTAGELRCSAGSYIVTAIQNREEILVWTDIALYTMNYVGAPYTYGLQLVGTGFDIIGPNAKTVSGSTAYWMGYNNFYSYNGRVEPMPCQVRDYVFLNINRAQGNKVYCSADTGNNEIIWFYPSADSNENNRYVVYNYAENIWYYGAMCRSAWIDRGTNPNPRAICTTGYLFIHEQGYDDGSTNPPTALDAYVESSPIEIEQGDHYGFVSRIIPDLTFRDTAIPMSPEPVVKFIVKPQNFPGGQTYAGETRLAQRSAAATLTVNRFTEQLFTRIRGRSVVLRVESDGLGVGWRMGSPRLDIKPDGRK